jgi:hypothetical protein
LAWFVAAVIGTLFLAYLLLRPPELRSYYATRPAVLEGESVDLVWQVDRAASVSIDPPIGIRVNPGDSSVQVTPVLTTQYTLTASNWAGLTTTAKALVKVVRILEFSSYAGYSGIGMPTRPPPAGGGVTLTWRTDGAESVTIVPGDEIRDPNPTGSADVHPTGHTSYTLTAVGPGGVEVTQTINVEVAVVPPRIAQFRVTKPTLGTPVYPGDPIELSWSGSGLTAATITADQGDVAPGEPSIDVTGQSSVTVRPTQRGAVQYTLTVSNSSGSQTATTSVAISPVVISEFTASPGFPSALQWSVQGANDLTRVSIEPDIGPVAANGKLTVGPAQTTQYVLTVISADGTTLHKAVNVSAQSDAQIPIDSSTVSAGL